MKGRVWRLLVVTGVLGLLLAWTAVGQQPFTGQNRMMFWTRDGNPVLVAELKVNFTLHDLYVYIEWDYGGWGTIKDIWFFEQTLNAGDRIPLYAPRRHANPWASLAAAPIRSWGWYDYTRGTGRCTYGKLQVTRCSWNSSDRAVYGTVQNNGRIATGYVAFAALYDNNGTIIAANWAEKEGVYANDTDNFTVGFSLLNLPKPVNSVKCWVFQGQWGWQYVGAIFPSETKTWPGLRNACPSE